MRKIGIIGTAARLVLGLILAGSVVRGHLLFGFKPLPWLIGLVGFPGVFFIWHWWRIRREPDKIQATGTLSNCLNIIIFFAFYFTYWYDPGIGFLSDAVLIFYGTAMLVAAVRGYVGCEILALSNWLLRRDDQVGCLIFSPFDYVDCRLTNWADTLRKK